MSETKLKTPTQAFIEIIGFTDKSSINELAETIANTNWDIGGNHLLVWEAFKLKCEHGKLDPYSSSQLFIAVRARLGVAEKAT